MIKFFENFNDEPFIEHEHMIFKTSRADYNSYQLVYILNKSTIFKSHAECLSLGWSLYGNDWQPGPRTLLYDYNDSVYSFGGFGARNILDLEWRGFDESEAIENLYMLMNSEKYNL